MVTKANTLTATKQWHFERGKMEPKLRHWAETPAPALRQRPTQGSSTPGDSFGVFSLRPLWQASPCGSWSNVRRNGDTGERSLEHEWAPSRVHADRAAPCDRARGGPDTWGVQELRRRGRLDPMSSEGHGLSQQDVIRGELPKLCSCLSSLKANRLHLWCSWHWPWLPGRAFPTLQPGDGRLRTPASSSPSPSLLFLILLLRGLAWVFFGRFPYREYCVPQGCFLKPVAYLW